MRRDWMLSSYLNRIDYQGPRTPTLEVLRAIHRQHVLSIAYENIDVVLQHPVNRSIEPIHNKLVTQHRGGWCYEMNGLLGWALKQIGFRVTQLSGGVLRQERGDEAYGNHLLLRVDLDPSSIAAEDPNQPTNLCWLADVGLGDGLLEPIPLVAGEYEQRGEVFRLLELDEPRLEQATAGQSWRFLNHPGGLPASFDFINQAADQTLLDRTCATLQSDANSIFRRNLVIQRVGENNSHLLLGRLYTSSNGDRQLLDSPAALSAVLTNTFGLAYPSSKSISDLWALVCTRHIELFGDTPVDQISLGPKRED